MAGSERLDGGRTAARGFEYQYLRTIEAMLDPPSTPNFHACRIEGAPPWEEESDAVDFDLVTAEGRILLAAQVKTRNHRNPYPATDAWEVLTSLVRRVTADKYQLLVNCRPSDTLVQLRSILGSGSPETAKQALLDLFKNAPSRKSDVAELSAADLHALLQAEIVIDTRAPGEVRQQVQRSVQLARARRSLGAGDHSSGVLLGYLLSEVHRRAADPAAANWTADEFVRALALDNQTLQQLMLHRDWSVVAGPMASLPDVARPDVLSEVEQALRPDLPPGDRVQRCVLLGLSGIGKSSLAAGYAGEHLNDYDLVIWLDATDEATMANTFRTVGSSLGLDTGQLAETSNAELPELVRRTLTTRIGRWLLVVDNVGGPELIHRWTPQLGNGDVLATSINSGVPWKSISAVRVEAMTDDQATDLLRVRLDVGEAAEWNQALGRLATELGSWPLALELAAGYINSCSIGPSEVSWYLEELKIRSLDDAVSVPAGYPRTLVAAFDLAIRSVRTAAAEDLSSVALGALLPLAFLAETRVPLSLLLAAAHLEPESIPSSELSPVIPHGDDVPVPELLRLLSTASLVRLDRPLPPSKPDLPFATVCVSTNRVLQDIVRSRIVESPAKHTSLRRLSFHLERWLTGAIDRGEYGRLAVIEVHANVLANYLLELDVADNWSALLLGNLAKVHLEKADRARAAALLRAEMSMLARDPQPNNFVREQASLQLALNGLASRPSAGEADEYFRLLEDALAAVHQILREAAAQDDPEAGEWHAAAMTVCACLGLDAIAFEESVVQRAGGLRAAFDAVLAAVPTAAPTQAFHALRAANSLLAADEVVAAEKVCRQALEVDHVPIELRHELRRFLMEALAMQGNWSGLLEETDKVGLSLDDRPPAVSWAGFVMQNVGLACGCGWLGSQDRGAIEALRRVCQIADRVRDELPAPAQQKLKLLELVVSIADADRQVAADLLLDLLKSPHFDPAENVNEAWRAFLAFSVEEAEKLGIFVRTGAD
ncbi:ATP-binding protein [Kribbella sp. NPDC026611]|uniref:ATP-binding protein n=1 Tax=Kribbella sp. NPDC026611 TaxID=3154911 RepID=UPI0033FBC814